MTRRRWRSWRPLGVPAADELLSGIAANVRSLDLAAVDARYVDQVGAVAPDGSWSGVAELTWRVRGFDERAGAQRRRRAASPRVGEGLGIAEFAASDAAGHSAAAVAPWPLVGAPGRTASW